MTMYVPRIESPDQYQVQGAHKSNNSNASMPFTILAWHTPRKLWGVYTVDQSGNAYCWHLGEKYDEAFDYFFDRCKISDGIVGP